MRVSEVIYLGELRTKCTHIKSGTTIHTDAPIDNHGKGEMFSPTDLVATSLSSCILTTMEIVGKSHNIQIGETKSYITKIMTDSPRRIKEIVVEIFFSENNFSNKEKTILKKIAENCPVALSLHPDIKQNITLNF